MKVFIQVGCALKHMHDRRIIHRDIKASNIFIAKNGNFILGDLGTSRILHKEREQANTFCGTKQYMAPEVFYGSRYTCKVDVWSLGILLYYLATFKFPYVIEGTTLQNVWEKELMEDHYSPLL